MRYGMRFGVHRQKFREAQLKVVTAKRYSAGTPSIVTRRALSRNCAPAATLFSPSTSIGIQPAIYIPVPQPL